MSNHAAPPVSPPEPRPGRRRWAALLASALLGSLVLVVSPMTASANELADGGGYYCAPEFESCPAGGSWCTWYGTCPGGGGGGGGGYDGGGGGGGGGGGLDINCGTSGQAVLVDGWIVKDFGTCRTIAICRAKRDAINAVAPGDARAYCWANWNIPNSNGRHLVFALPANG